MTKKKGLLISTPKRLLRSSSLTSFSPISPSRPVPPTVQIFSGRSPIRIRRSRWPSVAVKWKCANFEIAGRNISSISEAQHLSPPKRCATCMQRKVPTNAAASASSRSPAMQIISGRFCPKNRVSPSIMLTKESARPLYDSLASKVSMPASTE